MDRNYPAIYPLAEEKTLTDSMLLYIHSSPFDLLFVQLVVEFQYLRTQAVEPLATFLMSSRRLEIIKSSLIKYWIEDFAIYVDSLVGATAEIMGDLLKVRADTNAINITLNSFGTPLNEPAMRASDRKRLYPALGHLYPAGTSMLGDMGDEDVLGRRG